MEDNIKEMRIRHKAEIKELQDNCSHWKQKTTTSPWEKHTICEVCGKLLKRERN